MLFFVLSFVAGVLSVFAACVLPLLPVIVGGSLTTGGSRKRAYTIVASLAVSIVLFTLLLKATTALIGIPEALWRYLSGGIIVLLGIFILFPKLWVSLPFINALNRSSNKLLGAGYQKGGFWGDVVMGSALGPVFASCSPTYFIILATVLPATPLLGIVYLSAYAVGLSLTLLLIAFAGERLVQKLGVSLSPDGKFFKGIGVLLIVVGLLVFTGAMKKVETWLVERGFDATFIELKLLGADKEHTPSSKDNSFMSTDMKEGVYVKAPELVAPHGYINTAGEPITLEELRGKVVLLDIWTYSCINCQRTLPYLRAWHEAYADEGLVIVGVHTPEFAFEKDIRNVQKAVEEFGLEYPVVLDNEYATWNAYGNNFWPRKYLIDIDGYIVYDHIGEGAYEETEEAIRRALKERAMREGEQLGTMPTTAEPEGVVEVARGGVQSPEVYFGAWRNDLLGNGTPRTEGTFSFTAPEKPIKNTLYFDGRWRIADEYAGSTGEGSIVFFYEAKNVYFVGSGTSPIDVGVYVDGVFLKTIRVDEHRLYDAVLGDAYGEHTLELRVEDAGFEIYTFTFG